MRENVPIAPTAMTIGVKIRVLRERSMGTGTNQKRGGEAI